MKKTQKIVVIYNGDDWHNKNPFESQHTQKSFEDWHERGQKNNIDFFRASIDWYNEKEQCFEKGWAYRHGTWKKINSNIFPDAIFDKIAGKYDYHFFEWKLKTSQKIHFFNNPLFRTIFDNKLSQYLILKKFMAPSFLATTPKDLSLVLKKITSSRVVLKPLYGSGGEGIIIAAKKGLNKKSFVYPVLVQEFIQSDKGIPGFSTQTELSDLRMVFLNNTLIFALSRIAKKGSLFTNFHKGAGAIIVPEKKIPQSAKKMAREISLVLSAFPKAHYSLDFIFTNQGHPVLIEINTTPGLDLLNIVGNEKIKNKNFTEFTKTIFN